MLVYIYPWLNRNNVSRHQGLALGNRATVVNIHAQMVPDIVGTKLMRKSGRSDVIQTRGDKAS